MQCQENDHGERPVALGLMNLPLGGHSGAEEEKALKGSGLEATEMKFECVRDLGRALHGAKAIASSHKQRFLPRQSKCGVDVLDHMGHDTLRSIGGRCMFKTGRSDNPFGHKFCKLKMRSWTHL